MIRLNYFAESQSSLHGERKIQRLPALAVEILKKWYDEHKSRPYFLSDTDVENLAREGNITEERVRKWMCNKRCRSKNTFKSEDLKKLRKEEKNKNPKATRGHNKPHPSHPSSVVKVLKEFYENNNRPKYAAKKRLAEEAKITVRQVSCWFSNKRNRPKKQKPDSQSESGVDDVTSTANDNVSNSDNIYE